MTTTLIDPKTVRKQLADLFPGSFLTAPHVCECKLITIGEGDDAEIFAESCPWCQKAYASRKNKKLPREVAKTLAGLATETTTEDLPPLPKVLYLDDLADEALYLQTTVENLLDEYEKLFQAHLDAWNIIQADNIKTGETRLPVDDVDNTPQRPIIKPGRSPISIDDEIFAQADTVPCTITNLLPPCPKCQTGMFVETTACTKVGKCIACGYEFIEKDIEKGLTEDEISDNEALVHLATITRPEMASEDEEGEEGEEGLMDVQLTDGDSESDDQDDSQSILETDDLSVTAEEAEEASSLLRFFESKTSLRKALLSSSLTGQISEERLPLVWAAAAALHSDAVEVLDQDASLQLVKQLIAANEDTLLDFLPPTSGEPRELDNPLPLLKRIIATTRYKAKSFTNRSAGVNAVAKYLNLTEEAIAAVLATMPEKTDQTVSQTTTSTPNPTRSAVPAKKSVRRYISNVRVIKKLR